MTEHPLPEHPLPEHVTAADHARALISLQLLAGEGVEGPAPNHEELALLSTGQLMQTVGHRRYQAILAHINADTDLLARWLELSEANQASAIEKNTKQTPRLVDWLKQQLGWRLPAVIATVSALVLAVSITLQNGDEGLSPSPAHQPPAYASSGNQVVDRNISHGALAAFRQLPQEQQDLLLSESNTPQPTQTPGELEHALAYQYGEELTRAWQHCVQHKTLGTDSRNSLQALQEALRLPQAASDCAAVERQWQQALGQR